MYVYIWKDTTGTPFYVGFTKNKRRTNPRNSGGRNWLCKQKLEEIGADRVTIELRPVFSTDEGVLLERQLIAEYGRIQTSNGPLTNLTSGGDGVHVPSPEQVEKLRKDMLRPDHPIRSAAAKAKRAKRMQDPDVKAKFIGDANPAKKPEVREKLKAVWADPVYRQTQSESRTGIKKNHSEETRAKLAENVRNNAEMKGWGERNGKDPEFDAKRIAGIRAAQDKRREKMSDPAALALRKARLKATMSSPEYLAKRAERNTPEYRAKLSAAKKEYWAKRKASSQNQACKPGK